MNDWASKRVEKFAWCATNPGAHDPDYVVDASNAIKLLRNEHQRAVRVVEQYLKAYGTQGSPCELICNDLIDKLKEGRS